MGSFSRGPLQSHLGVLVMARNMELLGIERTAAYKKEIPGGSPGQNHLSNQSYRSAVSQGLLLVLRYRPYQEKTNHRTILLQFGVLDSDHKSLSQLYFLSLEGSALDHSCE